MNKDIVQGQIHFICYYMTLLVGLPESSGG
jgi:hypothetical protein